MDKLLAFWNSPVGPRTVHFWGPTANWGIVIAGLMDFGSKTPDQISERMTATLFFYSLMFMRFSWMVKPRNFLLLSCHACNCTAQAALYMKKKVGEKELERLAEEKKNAAKSGEQLKSAILQGEEEQ